MGSGSANVATKVEKAGDWGGEPISCRLVVDVDEGLVYWGKPRLFSTVVPETSRWVELGMKAFTIRLYDDGRPLLKKYHLQFDTTKLGTFLHHVSKADGQRVLEALAEYKRRTERDGKRVKDIIDKYREREFAEEQVIGDFKSSGVVSLSNYVQQNVKVIGAATVVGADFMQERLREDKDAGHALAMRELVDMLKRATAEGKLTGILDVEADEYRDRAFVVQQSRVVNVSVDFNSLVTQLGNKGVVLQGIQCPECGGTTTEVPTGAFFTCDYCKSTVKATDIFDKFKGILESS